MVKKTRWRGFELATFCLVHTCDQRVRSARKVLNKLLKVAFVVSLCPSVKTTFGYWLDRATDLVQAGRLAKPVTAIELTITLKWFSLSYLSLAPGAGIGASHLLDGE